MFPLLDRLDEMTDLVKTIFGLAYVKYRWYEKPARIKSMTYKVDNYHYLTWHSQYAHYVTMTGLLIIRIMLLIGISGRDAVDLVSHWDNIIK